MAQISKFHTGSKIWNADTQTDVGTILHDGSYTATTTPTGTDTLLIKQGSTQRQITRDNLLYPAETVLTLNNPTFVDLGGGNFSYTLTEAQINANDYIIINKTPTANSQIYTVVVPNNSKPVRVAFSLNSAAFTSCVIVLRANKSSGEYFKIVSSRDIFSSYVYTGLLNDTYFDIGYNNSSTPIEHGLIYENINGKLKSITLVFQNEI
jgi:hypothetical protein